MKVVQSSSGEFWTSEEEKRLKDLYSRGESIEDIALSLKGRSKSAVYNRINLLSNLNQLNVRNKHMKSVWNDKNTQDLVDAYISDMNYNDIAEMLGIPKSKCISRIAYLRHNNDSRLEGVSKRDNISQINQKKKEDKVIDINDTSNKDVDETEEIQEVPKQVITESMFIRIVLTMHTNNIPVDTITDCLITTQDKVISVIDRYNKWLNKRANQYILDFMMEENLNNT